MKSKPIITGAQEIRDMKKTIDQIIERINKSYKRINIKLNKLLTLLRGLDDTKLKMVREEVLGNVSLDYSDHEKICNLLLDAYNLKAISRKTRDKYLAHQEHMMKLEKEIMDIIG